MRGEEYGFLDRVGHEQDGLAAFAPDPQHFEVHLFAGQRVERAERLVHQDQFWIVDEGAGDRRALLHAAGQLLRIFVFVAGEPDQIEQIAGAGPRGLHRQADDFGRQQHVVQNGSPFQQQRLLEHHADIAGGVERCFRIADLDGAAVGVMQPGQDLQHRGLAAAGGADQRDQLAFPDVHGDVGDGEEFRALGTIDLADVLQADEGLVGAHASHFCKFAFTKASSERSACSRQTRSICCIWPGLSPSAGSRHQSPCISPCRRRISWQPAMQP